MKQNKVLIIGSVVAFIAITALAIMYYYNNTQTVGLQKIHNEETFVSQQNKTANTSADGNSTKVTISKKDGGITNDADNALDEDSVYMKHVLAIKKPTEKELEVLEKSGRYGEQGFEAGLRMMINHQIKNVNDEIMTKMVEIGKLSAYRHDVLTNQYANGEITKEFFLKAVQQNINLTNFEHKKFLTEEQYQSYTDGDISNETEIDMEVNKEKEFFAAFPNIQQNNVAIKNLDDLYEYVDVDIVEKLIKITEDDSKFSLRLEAKIDRGEISEDNAMKQLIKRKETSDNATLQLLTSEQQALFFIESNNDDTNPDDDYEREELDEEDVDALLTPEQQETLERDGSVFIPPEQ